MLRLSRLPKVNQPRFIKQVARCTLPFVIFILLGAFPVGTCARQISEVIHINSGYLELVDGVQIPLLAYNKTSVFSPEGRIITTGKQDTLVFHIINNDSLEHGFAVDGIMKSDNNIKPGDTAIIFIMDMVAPVYRFYDPLDHPKNVYLGLTGIIRVGLNDLNGFYWNLRTHQTNWTDSISSQKIPDWKMHEPDYFTINGRSNPHINNDKLAKIIGNVGDTLLIYIVNGGLAAHSLHFHGYHVEIVYSSRYANHKGRIKDTVPVMPGSVVLLQLVPDKPGEFPVHDHNLVAVSGGKYYPNGMFLTMLISP